MESGNFEKKTTPLYSLDLFSGLLGFHVASRRAGNIETICTSEIDPYCTKLIDQKFGLDNAGNIELICINRDDHPHEELIDKDLVPVEETGLTSLCIEDFYEGVLPFPSIITGGFPCQDVSSSNLLGSGQGINGSKSILVEEQLRIIEDLEPPFAIFENAEALVYRGLDQILTRLNALGYIVEWETISATSFGYPHYRHRCYLVAYRPETSIAKNCVRVFDYVRAAAQTDPTWNMPLRSEDAELIKKWAVVEIPKSIKLRTKRINALGNAIIPDIAASIFKVIVAFERFNGDIELKPISIEEHSTHHLDDGRWGMETFDLFSTIQTTDRLPSRGIMADGTIKSSSSRCRRLNPTKITYSGLYSTLIRKDGNNNFTCKSRLSRPGKLGGLVGEIMGLGVESGGLNPEFCEAFMGYEQGHTELPTTT